MTATAPLPIDTDARLIERARRGDGEAFDALMRRYMRAAYAVALGQTGDRDDAEDVCQDAFVTALRRLDEAQRILTPEQWRQVPAALRNSVRQSFGPPR